MGGTDPACSVSTLLQKLKQYVMNNLLSIMNSEQRSSFSWLWNLTRRQWTLTPGLTEFLLGCSLFSTSGNYLSFCSDETHHSVPPVACLLPLPFLTSCRHISQRSETSNDDSYLMNVRTRTYRGGLSHMQSVCKRKKCMHLNTTAVLTHAHGLSHMLSHSA